MFGVESQPESEGKAMIFKLQFSAKVKRPPPRPATGVSRALRARSVSASVAESVPEHRGVSREYPMECLWGPLGPGLRSVQKVSRECPRSVEKVSQTLRAHSRDTVWTLRSRGLEWPQRHPEGHSRKNPGFRGHSRGHSRRHFGPERPL